MSYEVPFQRLRNRELTGGSEYDYKGPWTERARHMIREELRELREDVRQLHSQGVIT